MQAGTLDDTGNPWTFAMFRITRTVNPRSAPEQAAYAKWLDQRTDREAARADRTHGAEGVIPLPLWIVLLLSALIIFVFMLFFADSAERAVVQATMMGGVTIVITSTLLLLVFLDRPYHSGPGGLRPVAMERADPHPRPAGSRLRPEAHHPLQRARSSQRRLRPRAGARR